MTNPVPAAFFTTRTHIAGIPVADLARQFGTPTYVYDAAAILRRLADLAAFDHVRTPKRPARTWPCWISCAATVRWSIP